MQGETGDFAQGSVAGNILRLALPMTFAQLVNVLYNMVDRMYLGHLPGDTANMLAGVGLTFPVLLAVTAFSNLFGAGGAPLFSMARGRGDTQEARCILGTSFTLLLLTGVALPVFCYLVRQPLLYLLGASDLTYPYAEQYLNIYLTGSIFMMIGLGLNPFINAQGFARTGMMTVLLGAVANIILDPLLIFGAGMGVRGAALATVISQLLSAVWALRFLRGEKALIRLERRWMGLPGKIVLRITRLGFANFVMTFTNCIAQAVCNTVLQQFGGELYVSVMTILSSVREVSITPANSLTNAGQPMLSFNYGAGHYKRVRQGIFWVTLLCVGYTTVMWLVILLFPRQIAALFTTSETIIAASVPTMQVYFAGIFLMALQMAGQCATVALGRARQAIFFSLLRKAFIIIPLTLWLPHVAGLGVYGVFLAEPISNVIGGVACYVVMLLTIGRELSRKEKARVAAKAPSASPLPGPGQLLD